MTVSSGASEWTAHSLLSQLVVVLVPAVLVPVVLVFVVLVSVVLVDHCTQSHAVTPPAAWGL